MIDLVRRLVWFAVVAVVASFAIFVVLGNFATTAAQGLRPTAIHDSLSPGMHRLSGILVLPFACDELSVEVNTISLTQYSLAFQTWQDPSIACPQTPTPRAFLAVAFAPSLGVNFSATLDGRPFPIVVTEDIASSSPHL